RGRAGLLHHCRFQQTPPTFRGGSRRPAGPAGASSRIILGVRTPALEVLVVGRPAALAALPEGYGPLFDRAAAVFEADGRVRAMWLHGALARGQADAASDLDISVAIADDGFDGFAASWRGWLGGG